MGDDETGVLAQELLDKFTRLDSCDDESVKDAHLQSMVKLANDASKTLCKKGMVSMAKNLVDLAADLKCCQTILVKAMSHAQAKKSKAESAGKALLKVAQDAIRKHSFRVELFPRWIKRAYYELTALKLFVDDGIAQAMAVVSMDALPFAAEAATELQYHALAKLFYKFLTSLETMADADRNAAVIKATQADGHYGLQKGGFVGCDKSTDALKVLNVLKRHAELPVAEVSWAYNIVKTHYSAPTTAHLCFICHRMFNLSLNHHLLSLFVCLLLPRARRTHTHTHLATPALYSTTHWFCR